MRVSRTVCIIYEKCVTSIRVLCIPTPNIINEFAGPAPERWYVTIIIILAVSMGKLLR